MVSLYTTRLQGRFPAILKTEICTGFIFTLHPTDREERWRSIFRKETGRLPEQSIHPFEADKVRVRALNVGDPEVSPIEIQRLQWAHDRLSYTAEPHSFQEVLGTEEILI